MNKIRVNVPSNLPDGKKKVVCPLCLYNCKEIPMVYEEKLRQWTCNNCKYILPRHLDPVENPVITAGNDAEFLKPYTRAVDLKRPMRKIVSDTGIHDNPMSAWQAGEDVKT